MRLIGYLHKVVEEYFQRAGIKNGICLTVRCESSFQVFSVNARSLEQSDECKVQVDVETPGSTHFNYTRDMRSGNAEKHIFSAGEINQNRGD